MGEREYVVQRGVVPVVEQSPEGGGTVEPVVTLMPAGHASEVKLWEDFATVPVPARQQRRTVIERVTGEIPDGDLPQFFRVLDPDSGAVVPLHLGVPKPQPKRRMVG